MDGSLWSVTVLLLVLLTYILLLLLVRVLVVCSEISIETTVVYMVLCNVDSISTEHHHHQHHH